ncbi:MAG: VWA domain-containing protein [Acidobacteria bacterium]|nr:VWA domain-containing protein [Acidobacteriota bacterium]
MGVRLMFLGGALLAWVLLSPAGTAAQSDTPPSAPSSEPENPSGEPDQQYVFPVEIEVVTVPVTVTNSAGEFVTDLNKNEFTVLDNGAPQKIESVELSWDPISLVIAVETSSRVESLLPEVRKAGILFTQLILGETGEAAVLAFDNELKLVQGFTDDPELVETALEKLSAGGEQVRLSDAIARGIFLLQQRPQGRRKVVIAISEARDQGSSNSHGFVLRGAQQLGVSIYTVGLSTLRNLLSRPPGEGVSSPFPPGVAARPMPGSQPPTPDAQTNWGAANVNLLELIAELVSTTKSWLGGNPLAVYATGTGGQEFASGDKGALERSLGRIGQELRNQYLLTYRPNNLDSPGFHSIRVTISRPNLMVRTRPGYMFTRLGRRSPASTGEGSQPAPEAVPSLR